jgi:hypothetical protein
MKLHWPDLTFGPINLLNCPYLSLWKEDVKTQQCEKCAQHNSFRDESLTSGEQHDLHTNT